MEEFRSLHLQKNLGEVLVSAEEDPVVLLNRGQPRAVIMSAEEFRRLKVKAGEVVPSAAMLRKASIVRQPVDSDPLGYDTSDLMECARLMSSNALSGRNANEVASEMERARKFLQRTEPADVASFGAGR